MTQDSHQPVSWLLLIRNDDFFALNKQCFDNHHSRILIVLSLPNQTIKIDLKLKLLRFVLVLVYLSPQ